MNIIYIADEILKDKEKPFHHTIYDTRRTRRLK